MSFAARRAADSFLAGVPKKVNVRVVALSSKPRVLQSPTTERLAMTAALDQLTPRGGTGRADTGTDADRQCAVYKHLGSQLGHKNESARSLRASPAAPSLCWRSAPRCPAG